MPSYDKTALWQQALAPKIDDSHSSERERLRVAYENVRKRAQPIAETIAKDLPDFTVHDITHSDALWEYADLLAGSHYALNPCEAFVLGCAFLVHDLGMGLAAYPEGLPGLKKLVLWKDTVADQLRQTGMEEITDHAIEHLSVDVEKRVIAETLRRLHAERADKLGLIHWTSPCGDQRFYLIEDPELRDAFGPIIGRIAFSHWWPIDQVGREFSAIMGAPADFPQNWTVDPLKLACILRCADYSHIDERRAPLFLRALRRPEGSADEHWKFQGKLYQPRLEGDRLIFTAKSAFTIDEAAAWWLCFDTLTGIDAELRKTDSLLADTRRERLSARGVSQAEEPSRLAKLIKTDGWQPVDTRIRVSDVADLVAKLGGKDLYGDSVTPPLREMIQNGADAVRARRLIDSRAPDWGEIRVSSGTDGTDTWIQVEDTGVGMSETVLTGPLLDFGTSFWRSPMMHDQLPGLAAKGFQATGRYGIGFFSVFMWGKRVEVVTQRFDKGRSDTLVLSFRKGLQERPLLRQARPEEYIPDGGTRVKIWLSNSKTLERLASAPDEDQKLTFAQVCARMAPCSDVTIRASDAAGSVETAATASDWLVISDEALLDRVSPLKRPKTRRSRDNYFETAAFPKLQILKTPEGRVVGRAAIWDWQGVYSRDSGGVVTVGGLSACGLAGVIGVFVGKPQRAARDAAEPIIPIPVLKEWAQRERDARAGEGHPPEALHSIAQILVSLGVATGELPIARSESGWLTARAIEALAKEVDEVLLVSPYSVDVGGGHGLAVELQKGVLLVENSSMSIVGFDRRWWFEWPPLDGAKIWGEHEFYARAVQGAVIRALATGWGCSLEQVLEQSFLDSDDETFQREIGTLAGKPFIEDNVTIIRRPTASS